MYLKPKHFIPSYGTAGFRSHFSNLHSTVYRCGMLMAVRSILTQKTCGVMITASHNPKDDNGVKLIDHTGDMIDHIWEQYATDLCRLETQEEVNAFISNLVGNMQFQNAKVYIGMDTRASCPGFVQACIDGISKLNVQYAYFGMVTTPQLHYYVSYTNSNPHTDEGALFQIYAENMLNAFKNLRATNAPHQTLFVDCANGVGSVVLSKLSPLFNSIGLNIVLKNTGEGELNHLCGSDFVQREQTFPQGFENISENMLCCSLDGDADRIVYFTKRNDKFVLLNGDKIATLIAVYLKQFYNNIGIVQTAYSNGSSTTFIEQNGIHVACTPTGVKHLHHKAKDYNVGVYFEANGHGTVLFDDSVDGSEFKKLMNQNVGDAISNMLLIQAILTHYTLNDWNNMYDDLPCKQTKLHVENKDIIVTTDAERKCQYPLGLQDEIDTILKKFQHARAFVRPSGTEDIVRVYAESSSHVDILCQEIEKVVVKYCGNKI
jgi:phosphoacetylglucosamine mutase